jgi:hypothetical protein
MDFMANDSEKEIFPDRYEDWLDKVNIIIIELHDRYQPECSDAVYAAMNYYKFSNYIKGENVVFIRY